jgi:hypothetical protein
MRTTVTLDSDVEQLIHERMAAKGVSFKQALNDSIRDGVRGGVDYAFEAPTFDLGITIDLTKANQVAADLENAELLAKLADGR